MPRLVPTALFSMITALALPQTTVMPGAEMTWAENVGWINLRGDVSNGVRVHQGYLSGFAWSENIGWINFGAGPISGNAYTQGSGDTGVNRNPLTGGLSGFAWSENAGWINFDTAGEGGSQVVIDQSGVFSGCAWGENIGWVSFNIESGSGTNAVQTVLIPNAAVSDWLMY